MVFPAHASPADLAGFAARVEELGFDAVWVIEDCFLSGGLTMAATALAVTTTIQVGVGLMPATVRNPAIAAMEIATLARMHPGRFEATLGHGVAEWMHQIGALPDRRLAALAEITTAIRQLLAGETVTTEGSHVRLSQVALEQPPGIPPPVLIGTTGPKGLSLAGRHADGILLAEGCGPDFVRWAIRQTGAGPGARCVTYAWFSLDDDLDQAAKRLMPALDQWLRSDLFPHPKQLAAVPDVAPHPQNARVALIERLAVCGNSDTCAAAIWRFATAGADTIALVAPPEDFLPQLAAFAETVMPALRA